MIRPCVASVFLVLAGLVSAQSADDPSLDSQLERARELSITAPWHESQALLDNIEPRLAEATPEQRADFWLIKARNQTLAGEMDAALETLERLLEQPLTHNQKARAFSLAANVATLLRRWEAAFSYLDHALSLVDELDPANVGPFSLAAYLYAKIGQVDEAIDYGQRAVTSARSHGSARDLCINQGRLAFVYKTANRYPLALRHYRDALANCREVGDELIAGTIESGLADLLRATGEFEQARSLFEQALAKLEQTDYQTGLAEARLYSARLYREQGDDRRTEAEIETALPQLEHDLAWDYVAEGHQMLGEIALGRGQAEAALAHMRAQLDARERFLNLERARQLAWLQVAFDMRSREQELALLREQRRVAELESESQRNREHLRWLVFALGAVVFLALLLLLVHVQRERRHFRRLAGLDSLTGLSNHTRFFDSARMMVEEARLGGQPLVLALGDIDHFKRVNDEFGHIAGDRALTEVARVLREAFPSPGLVGRIGGEEFAICLPGQAAKRALPRLAALREALAGIDYGGDSTPLTMSFGLAELQPEERLEVLRRRADEALYRAKRSGRNLIIVAD